MKVAYLGPAGTYSYEVARELFRDEELLPFPLIMQVTNAVETGKADYGVVPIENIITGEVKGVLYSISEQPKTRIIGEKRLEVVHCLGALSESSEIKEICSIPEALEQCSKYINNKYSNVNLSGATSTANAAVKVENEKKLGTAAIAPEESLRKYNLKVIDKDIVPKNKTRFLILGKDYLEPTGDDKTFLALHPLNDKEGLLIDLLTPFKNKKINLELIASRPDGNDKYYFYLELNRHKNNPDLKDAVQEVRDFLIDFNGNKRYNPVKILGSYKNTHWKDEN